MEFGGPRKRGRGDNGNGGFKKSRSELESFQSGVASKLKPCTKYFSTSGCPFGEGCHFLHHVPGGFKAVSQMKNLAIPGSVPPPYRNAAAPLPFLDGPSAPAGKSKMCTRFNTAEGCKFGDKCHFSHGELRLGRPSISSYEDPRGMDPMSGRGADFGTTATAKISIDSSIAGSFIGKSGANTKHISRVTGVKIAIRDHESDPNLKNVELEGTFDKIEQATTMLRELMANIKGAAGPPQRRSMAPGGGSNIKTKLCEKFSNGCCTFGDRCHFAHGAEELRKSA